MRGIRGQTGFTLLELLVAAGIVALLASLAWPSYAQLLHRARRVEARLGLLSIQHAQERFYLGHLRYADSLDRESGLAVDGRSDSGDYRFSVEASGDGQHYRAIATADPQGRQRRDAACAELAIDATGIRTARDAAGNPAQVDCW